MELDYTTLDRILWRLERGMNTESIAAELGIPPGRVRYVEILTQRSEYLRTPPRTPVLAHQGHNNL